MEIALECDAKIVGINNRDLRTFQTSLDTTERLRLMVPKGKITVSESGIKTPGDIEKLGRIGVDAVLIGESLVRSDSPTRTLQWLRGTGLTAIDPLI
jgi:indole-3-glycerol phosphate synthase